MIRHFPWNFGSLRYLIVTENKALGYYFSNLKIKYWEISYPCKIPFLRRGGLLVVRFSNYEVFFRFLIGLHNKVIKLGKKVVRIPHMITYFRPIPFQRGVALPVIKTGYRMVFFQSWVENFAQIQQSPSPCKHCSNMYMYCATTRQKIRQPSNLPSTLAIHIVVNSEYHKHFWKTTRPHIIKQSNSIILWLL